MQRISGLWLLSTLIGALLTVAYGAAMVFMSVQTGQAAKVLCWKQGDAVHWCQTHGIKLGECTAALQSNVQECLSTVTTWPDRIYNFNAAMMVPLLFLLSFTIARSVWPRLRQA